MNRILRLFVCWAALNTAATAFAAQSNILLTITAPWRYTTNNLDGVNWTLTNYNDSSWSGPGNALLYIEDGTVPATKSTPLPEKPGGGPVNTYYFRTTFQVANHINVTSLVFSNLVDDGAVFYLNGVEIQRLYMAAGTVVYSTFSSSSHEASSYDVFAISGNLLTNLVEGTNTLAVEVHQTSVSSSDIVFGSALTSSTETNIGGLFFDGVNDYVTFGVSSSLNVSNFTLECWFKRTGTGATAGTGTGGVTAYPLVTRGRGEADASNVDCNYFLGFNSSGQLVADFEDFNNGLNHPITGTTAFTSNSWQHAAVTYDVNSGTWTIYLNGVSDTTSTISGTDAVRTPRYDSIQHAGLATALNSSGTPSGFFNGTLDEVRVWNYARSASQIGTNYYVQITNATGLVARWSLDDASGTTATNSIAGGVNGTLVNGPLWSGGYPFSSINNPPTAPTLNAPTNNQTGVTNYPVLNLHVSDPDTNALAVTFYGRVANVSTQADFTVIALPDTQFYSETYSNVFTTQTDWIVSNRAASNIAYVAHLGDCVQNGDNGGNDLEWRNATNALYRLENPATTLLPNGIPYGVAVGNHDQGASGTGVATDSTTFFNQYFGTNHFLPFNYYGGNYSTNNDNHYDLFSAGGMDFIAIYFEYDTTLTSTNAAIFAWANGLLQTYPGRRGIVVSHWIMNSGTGGSFGAQGQAIYDALKANTNLFLMFCGHVTPNGEGRRSDTFNSKTVWTLLSDYQDLANGGNGWLRIYEFSPTNNVIRAKTYSPWLNQYQTGSGSQFEIPYAMTPTNPFTLIGTVANVGSGSDATLQWPGLATNTTYEWYATISDGQAAITSALWRFTTGTNAGALPPPPAQTNVLLSIAAPWRYQTNNLDGVGWTAANYNDSSWFGPGNALLYVETDPLPAAKNTPLPERSGGGPLNTYYFRTSFVVSNAQNVNLLVFSNLVDDGAVYYLNGVEIQRLYMSAGGVVYTNRSSVSHEATSYDVFSIAGDTLTNLLEGTNVLAAEVHQTSSSSTDIVFGSAVTEVRGAAASLTRGPYLQLSTPTSIVIRWRTTAGANSRIIYGTNLAVLNLTNDISSLVSEHIITLTNLQPDTKYYYSIGSTTSNLAAASASQFFLTHPLPGTTKPMRIWVIGDAGTATANQTAVYTSFTNFNGTNLVRAWLQLGDNAYDEGSDADYQTAVFDVYSDLLRRSVTWPTLGNHETKQLTDYVDTYPYFNMFTLPTAGEAGGVASGTEHYYSFDLGMAHFICLDSMTADRSPNGAMLTWLQSDLAVTTNRWIIAYWHHPPYTKGSHNSDTEADLGSVRTNFLPILEAGGVDLILSGHSHSYERSFLLNGHYGLSSIFNSNTMVMQPGGGAGAGAYRKHDSLGYPALPNRGAVYAVAGSSGKTSGGTLNHPAMYYSTNALGSMVLDFNSNRLDIIFLRETTITNDTFTLIKDNNNPVANVASYARYRGGSMKISRTNLLATYTSDPDGDARSLAAVGTSPTASIVTNTSYIFYSATNPDSISNDTFGYIVSDGHGGTASNYILVTVTNAFASNNIVSLQTGVPGANSNTITFAGLPGYAYVVQYATNLPGNPWNDLATNTAGSNGFWIIVDPDATNASRFYRSKY